MDTTEQIQNRCIHFNGIQNTKCKASISYADVRIGRPYKFPCLNQGGTCDKCVFPTADEVETERRELEALCSNAIKIMADIKTADANSSQIPCECGGTIYFSKSTDNGHVRAKCNKCDIAIIE